MPTGKLKKILAVIPARKNSKRLSGKNMRALAGTPLMGWTINSAIESAVFDEILITSDDEDALEYARNFSVTTFRRPAELSTDSATTLDVVLNALDYLESAGRKYESVALLQVTSPLRTHEDIRSALALFRERKSASVVSVTPVSHPVEWVTELDDSQSLDALARRFVERQDLVCVPKVRLNGAIYIAKVAALRAAQSFLVAPSVAYKMPTSRSVDVDTIEDFNFCRFLVEFDGNFHHCTDAVKS